DAALSGFDDALVLNQDGHVSEGSAMNVFMLRDGILVTPPVTDNVLEGITRRSVMHLAENVLGLPVQERSIDRTELFICDEVFLTGTAAQVTAVVKVDHRPVGDGVMGPVTAQLRDVFSDLVRGHNPDFKDWITPVYS
ncbi:MAG: aminotransferase class IV, partial [Anaerolineales bacterium]|nr:aminotransferase class IV [Anaerolineales bacterium]